MPSFSSSSKKPFRYIAYDRLGNRLTFVGERHCGIADLQNTLRIGAGEAIAVRSLDRSHYSNLSLYLMENYFMEYTEPDLIDRVLRALGRGHLRLVQLEYGAKDKEANAATYLALQQTLAKIIQQAKATAAAQETVLAQESTLTQMLIYVGAFMHGTGSAAIDLAKWIKEVTDPINPLVQIFDAYKAAEQATDISSFLQNLEASRQRHLIEALGFDPSRISKEQLNEAYETLELLYEDEKIQGMLAVFCTDYVKAQHSVTYVNLAGRAAFEVILTAVLAALTGGAALASTAARASRQGGLFQDVGKLLIELANKTPKKRKRNTELKKQTAESRIENHAGEPAGLKAADNKLPPKPAKSKLPTPPKNMNEVHQRLDAAKIKLDTARANGQPLPTSPYSEADKFAMVNAGLQERFLVRVVESKYTGDQGSIGRPKPDGGANYWTTTYTQIEHADSDAKLINQALGIDHDPNKTYTLLIIDNEKATATGQMKSFIPTYDSLGTLAKSEMSGTNPVHIDKVMTPEYSATYAKHMEDAKAGGVKLDDPEQLSDFAAQKGLSTEDTDLLRARHKIHDEYGANEHFTGNGLTKDNNAPAGQIRHGTVETYTQDKNPQTIGTLKQNGVITVVDLS